MSVNVRDYSVMHNSVHALRAQNRDGDTSD